MRITLDKESNALYIYLSDAKSHKTREVTENSYVDIDENGELVGIEILEADRFIKELSHIQFDDITREIDYLSPEEMATMHNIAPNTVYRILRADLEKPMRDRRIPGATYSGEGKRRTWFIPRDVAEAFKPDPRGRKPEKPVSENKKATP